MNTKNTILIGFIASFFSFIAVSLLSLWISGYEFHESSFILITSSLIGSGLYSILYTLLFLSCHYFTFFLNRLNRLFSYAVPSLFYFWLLVEPWLNTESPTFHYPDSLLDNLRFIGLILLFLIFSFIFIRIFPSLSLFHSICILTAALIGRTLLPPTSLLEQEGAIQNIILYLLLTFSLFSTLSMQMYLKRSYFLQTFHIPLPRLIFHLLLFISPIVILVVNQKGISIPFLADEGETISSVTQTLYSLAMVWCLQGIVLLIIALLCSFRQNKLSEKNWGGLLITSYLFIGIFLCSLLNMIPRKSNTILEKPVSASSLTMESLYLFSILWDKDGDGNSLWPGNDPHDQDPCIRKDFRYYCIDFSWKLRKRNSYGVKNSDSHVILVSIVNPSDSEILPTFAGFYQRKLILHSDSSVRSIHSHWQNLTLREAHQGTTRESFISKIAQQGRRTICTGWTGQKDYFQLRKSPNLDQGCQIFQPLDSKKSELSFSFVGKYALKLYKEYRERKNFVWIHYHNPSGFSQKHRQELQAFISLVRRNTSVAVLQIFESSPQAYFFSQKPLLPHHPDLNASLLWLNGIGTTPPPQTLIRGALYESPVYAPYRQTLTSSLLQRYGSKYPSVPVNTFIWEQGKWKFFDGLSGFSYQNL